MEDTATLKDPVCGMEVTSATAISSVEHEGTTYYFCSEDCHLTFTEDPDSYT